MIAIDSQLPLKDMQLKKAAHVLRAINHQLRWKILQTIHDQRRMTVTELHKKLRLDQSVTSLHLSILRKAHFTYTERQGKFIFYSVNYSRLKEVQACNEALLAKLPALGISG
ncbi:MAG: ArsR/SmtB family transcription factor [Flavisolibacter sp.]